MDAGNIGGSEPPAATPGDAQSLPGGGRMTPVGIGERYEFLDVLRGCALFGVLAANMRGFFECESVYFEWRKLYGWTPDVAVQNLIEILVQGKFVTLFAAMFGIGFAIQMSRAEARGIGPGSFYPRRLGALFGFGVLHTVLVWWGDILTQYAAAGLLVFLFRKASRRTLVVWVATMWLAPIAGSGVAVVVHDFREGMGVAPAAQAQGSGGSAFGPHHENWRAERERALAAYQSRDIVRIQKQKLVEAGQVFFQGDLVGGLLFGFWLFLPGLLLWKFGWLEELEARPSTLRWVFWIALPVGLACSIAGAAWSTWAPAAMRDRVTFTSVGAQMMQWYGMVLQAAGYAAGLALLWLRGPAWHARLHPFAAVGRTALTNYLAQSVVCTTFFFATGLYGKVGPLWGLPATIALYAAQVVASNWWLRRYRYGPMEYVWRVVTYGRLPAV